MKMINMNMARLALTIIGGLGFWNSVRADGGFHFPIGITYSQGGYDTINKLTDAYQADWEVKYGVKLDLNKVNIPVGLTFNPYYEWNNGLGLGLDLGPTLFMAATLQKSGYGGTSQETKFSYIIPIGASVRYTFFRNDKISPYVRAGVRYPIAGGDNISSSQVGPFGALGVEILRTKRVGVAVEVGYDASKIKITSVKGSNQVTFAGLTAGLSVCF